MELKDNIVVVTGAAGGIGRALAQAFAEAGAKKIVCVDLDGDGAEATASPRASTDCVWVPLVTSVTSERDVSAVRAVSTSSECVRAASTRAARASDRAS